MPPLAPSPRTSHIMTIAAPDATPSPTRDGDTEGGAGDGRFSSLDLLVSRALPPRPTVTSMSQSW